jgi:hypothetical protein
MSDTSSRSFGLAPVTEYRDSGVAVQTGQPSAGRQRAVERPHPRDGLGDRHDRPLILDPDPVFGTDVGVG